VQCALLKVHSQENLAGRPVMLEFEAHRQAQVKAIQGKKITYSWRTNGFEVERADSNGGH
jgi:hypothetical protein